jgi:hypothetical protein
MTPYVVVGILTLLAALFVFTGVRFAKRMKEPRTFRTGSFVAAAGLMLLWISSGWFVSADHGIWAVPLFFAALFVPVSVLGVGLQLMARACGQRDPTEADRVFEDILRRNAV